MTRLVIDASVAVKWFLPEVYSHEATQILRIGYELHAPDLVWAEAGNAIWKRSKRGDLHREEGRRILQDLVRFPIEIHPSDLLLEAGYDIASYTGRTVYDSLCVALAVRLGCLLCTADRPLFHSLRESPLNTVAHWIGDPLPS